MVLQQMDCKIDVSVTVCFVLNRVLICIVCHIVCKCSYMASHGAVLTFKYLPTFLPYPMV